MTIYKLDIHLAGGQTIRTEVDDEDIEEVLFGDVNDYIEHQITQPAKPHWAWIGDAYVFTQAVSGVDVVDDYEYQEPKA